jgi:hypothetical protein
MSVMTEKWHGPLFAGCAFLLAAAAADGDIRLAGTIELEAGQFIAIVDDGAGHQRIVHVGDELAVGEIVSIGDREVRVRTTSGVLMLSLEGAAVPSPPEAEPPLVITDMSIGADVLLKLQAIPGGDEQQVTRQVLGELGLPTSLAVRQVWVADKQYSQMRVALPHVRDALRAGDIVHLFFEKGGPVDETYLMPVRPEQDD